MYRNTNFYAPQPIRPSQTQFVFQRNSCSWAIHSFIIERLECQSSTCHLHLVNAGFSKDFEPVENTTSFTATSQYYSSLEAGGSSFLGAMGQAGYAASGGPSRIEPAAFNTCQFIFTIPMIKQYSALLVDGLDPTLTSASFENASWSSAGSVQGHLTHVNCAWIPNENLIESSATGLVIPFSMQTSSMLYPSYPVFPGGELYRGPSQQLASQNTAPGTSSCKYGLDVHSTFPLPLQSVGSISDDNLPGGSSRGSSFPPRVVAPMPRRETPAFIPYDTPLGAAMPASGINPLHTMLSTWQQVSGTSNLINAPGDYGFIPEKQARNEPYSESALGTPLVSDFSHRKTNQNFSVRFWDPQPSCRSHRNWPKCQCRCMEYGKSR